MQSSISLKVSEQLRDPGRSDCFPHARLVSLTLGVDYAVTQWISCKGARLLQRETKDLRPLTQICKDARLALSAWPVRVVAGLWFPSRLS